MCAYMPDTVLELSTQMNNILLLPIRHLVLEKLGGTSSEDLSYHFKIVYNILIKNPRYSWFSKRQKKVSFYSTDSEF